VRLTSPLTLQLENIGGLFGDRRLVLKPGINIIKAPNATGKTSVIKALETLVLDDRDLASRPHYVHSFSGAARVELSNQDGTLAIRRLRKGANQVSVSGKPLYVQGRKAATFCIASEDNPLLALVKQGAPLKELLLGFSDHESYELLASLTSELIIRVERNLLDYKDQLMGLEKAKADLEAQEARLQELEIQRKAIPPIDPEIIAKNEVEGQRLADLQKRLSRVVSQIAATEGDIERTTAALHRAKRRHETVRELVERFQAEHPDVERELQELAEELATIDGKIREASYEMRVVQEKIDATGQNLSRYIAFEQPECFSCGQRLTKDLLLERRAQLDKTSSELASHIVALKSSRAEVESKRDHLAEQATKHRNEYRSELSRAAKEISAAEARIDQLNAQLIQLKSDRTNLATEVQVLEQVFDSDIRERLKLKRDVDEEIARTDERVKTLQVRLESLSEAEAQGQELESKLSYLRSLKSVFHGRAEQIKGRVRDEFNAQVEEVFASLGFDQPFERIYLDHEFGLKVIRRFRDLRAEVSIKSLSGSEREALGLVMMLSGMAAYVHDFPFFIVDETSLFDPTRLQGLLDYVAPRVPYVIVTGLSPVTAGEQLQVEHVAS